mgnify:CR=1 FL=1
MHGGGNVNAAAQLALSFEPGLTARFRTLEDCCQHVVLTSRGGVDGVAAHLDMAPSELSRRLNREARNPKVSATYESTRLQ